KTSHAGKGTHDPRIKETTVRGSSKSLNFSLSYLGVIISCLLSASKDLPMSLMLQEIAEQPQVLERTIEAERDKITRIGDFLRSRDVDLIVLVARGSSDNAALFGRYLLEVTTGIPVSLSAPSIFTLYKAKLRLNRAIVIGVSQSGEGDDINEVLESAKSSGAFTLAITNEGGSTMARLADETLLIHAGRERSVAAT